MLIFLRHRLVVLAMPKCASTAIEAAIGDRADIVAAGAPNVKHTTFRKYDRYLRPYLHSFDDRKFDTVCLFREPLDWFNSWWRYRRRADIPDDRKSTHSMEFAEFVEAALQDKPGPAKLGRQARFVSARDGSIGVDHIFRYENLPACREFLEQRLETNIDLARINVSPGGPGTDTLPDGIRAQAERALSDDYRIYREIAR